MTYCRTASTESRLGSQDMKMGTTVPAPTFGSVSSTYTNQTGNLSGIRRCIKPTEVVHHFGQTLQFLRANVRAMGEPEVDEHPSAFVIQIRRWDTVLVHERERPADQWLPCLLLIPHRVCRAFLVHFVLFQPKIDQQTDCCHCKNANSAACEPLDAAKGHVRSEDRPRPRRLVADLKVGLFVRFPVRRALRNGRIRACRYDAR